MLKILGDTFLCLSIVIANVLSPLIDRYNGAKLTGIPNTSASNFFVLPCKLKNDMKL